LSKDFGTAELLHDRNTLLVQHNDLLIRTTVTLSISRPYNRDFLAIAGFDSPINPLALVGGFFLDLDCSSLVLL